MALKVLLDLVVLSFVALIALLHLFHQVLEDRNR